MNGSIVDPTSKKDMKFKQYLKMSDDDHYIIEMNLDYNGQEFKAMEIEFVRQ